MSDPVQVSSLEEAFDIMARRMENATSATPSLAGKPYCPSSGSEGMAFEDQMCIECDHWRHVVGASDFDCTKLSVTPYGAAKKPMHILEQVWAVADTEDPEYPAEWVYNAEGRPTCTAWKARTEAADEQPAARPLCGGALTAEQEWAAYQRAMAEGKQ